MPVFQSSCCSTPGQMFPRKAVNKLSRSFAERPFAKYTTATALLLAPLSLYHPSQCIAKLKNKQTESLWFVLCCWVLWDSSTLEKQPLDNDSIPQKRRTRSLLPYIKQQLTATINSLSRGWPRHLYGVTQGGNCKSTWWTQPVTTRPPLLNNLLLAKRGVLGACVSLGTWLYRSLVVLHPWSSPLAKSKIRATGTGMGLNDSFVSWIVNHVSLV